MTVVVRGADSPVAEHFLARLVDRLPRTYRPDADAYLEVLDRALLDRHISAVEADALVSVADTLGLDRTDVTGLHENYLQALAVVAAADGSVTDDERHDLVTVATLLGLNTDQVERTLAVAHHALSLVGGHTPGTDGQFRLQRGDTVVFTGQMDQPREQWEAHAAHAGLKVGHDVTRHTRILVAADPDSMSGKATKAARYGIPVIHPTAFLQMLPD